MPLNFLSGFLLQIHFGLFVSIINNIFGSLLFYVGW